MGEQVPFNVCSVGYGRTNTRPSALGLRSRPARTSGPLCRRHIPAGAEADTPSELSGRVQVVQDVPPTHLCKRSRPRRRSAVCG